MSLFLKNILSSSHYATAFQVVLSLMSKASLDLTDCGCPRIPVSLPNVQRKWPVTLAVPRGILGMRHTFHTSSISKHESTSQEVGRFYFPHGSPSSCLRYNLRFLSRTQKDILEARAPSEGALRNGARTNGVVFCSIRGRASAVSGEIIFFLSTRFLGFFLTV